MDDERDRDTCAAFNLQPRPDVGFTSHEVKVNIMAVHIEERTSEQMPRVKLPLPPTATDAPSVPSEEQVPRPYRPDILIFLLWMGCFLLVAAMIFYETVFGLFFRR
jgi:hypothetical protein